MCDSRLYIKISDLLKDDYNEQDRGIFKRYRETISAGDSNTSYRKS